MRAKTETIRRLAAQRSRRYPLVALTGVAVIAAFELYSLRSSGQLHLVAVLVAPALLLLGLGGLVNPDVMFGARPDVEVPDSTRRVSRLLMYSGLALGMLGCWYLFFRR